MKYKVLTISLFDKQVKRLAKKYPSLKTDLERLLELLVEAPEQGSALGNNFYKIRLAITSKAKGKSGGARLITHLKISETTIYLVSIYDKSAKSTITDSELDEIFKSFP